MTAYMSFCYIKKNIFLKNNISYLLLTKRLFNSRNSHPNDGKNLITTQNIDI